jgi:hypothetical protein
MMHTHDSNIIDIILFRVLVVNVLVMMLLLLFVVAICCCYLLLLFVVAVATVVSVMFDIGIDVIDCQMIHEPYLTPFRCCGCGCGCGCGWVRRRV